MSSLPLTKTHGESTDITGNASASPNLRKADQVPHSADVSSIADDSSGSQKISAYARLDFDNYTFFVQTLQVVLGRKSNDELLPSAHHSVDVHLSSKKAISRRHAKIFYNFGTQRFEISVLGRNGAFVDDLFIEKGITVHLVDGTRIQIGDIPFTFVLPSIEPTDPENKRNAGTKFFNPTEALNLRTNLYLTPQSPSKPKKKLLAFSMDSAVDPKDKTKGPGGRRSSKADIVRRLSVARRKSLASSSNDEISALLKELEAFRDGDEDDDSPFDPDLLGGDIRSFSDGRSLTHDQILKQEDELDRLVKQHNMSQGVDLDSDTTFSKNAGLDVLDQEVASLAPLIDAQLQQLNVPQQRDIAESKYHNIPTNSYQIPSSGIDANRSAPLMGKPVGPRMGKPAPIPPPGGPLYGRPAINHMAGSVGGQPGAGYGQPSLGYGGYLGYTGSLYNSMMRPPPPKLEVAVETITSVPVKSLIVPHRAITVDVDSFEKAPICVFKTLEPITTAPKIPKRRKDVVYRRPVKVQNFKEVPEQFKTKPTLSILAMVSVVLKNKPNPALGQSFNDILDNIRELFPYYKYCPDGWQFTVLHGIKFNPMFVAILKVGQDSEWIWALDEKYIEEREARRKKLQELAVAKAKESALRAVDYRQRQGYSPYATVGRPGIPPGSPNVSHMTQSPRPGVPGVGASASYLANDKKDGPYTYTTPPSQMLQPGQEVVYQNSNKLEGNIKDQLAANRARTTPANTAASSAVAPANATASGVTTPSPAPAPLSKTPSSNSQPTMNQDTKKSLTYLQKELFTLYKARDLSYNTAITTEIITKALATTIAQVNSIGAKAGCGDNALGFLVEKAPQQVSKILDIALTKSIKDHQLASLLQNSRAASPVVGTTPGPHTASASSASAKKGLAKPPGVGGLGRPSFGGPSNLSGAKSGQSGPIKPPQFYSNKPMNQEKRPADSNAGPASKVIKLDD